MTIELRDLTNTDGGSCDWGHCNAPSVAARRDAEHGWLPVCSRHSGRIPRRPSPGRGECEVCGNDYAITVDGLLPLHSAGFARCAGSRRDPASFMIEAPLGTI